MNTLVFLSPQARASRCMKKTDSGLLQTLLVWLSKLQHNVLNKGLLYLWTKLMKCPTEHNLKIVIYLNKYINIMISIYTPKE